MQWPVNYPDLNPIEHMWDMLGRRIAALCTKLGYRIKNRSLTGLGISEPKLNQNHGVSKQWREHRSQKSHRRTEAVFW